MKNVEKIMIVLTKAFTGHKIEISYNFNAKIYCVFIDDNYVGNFEDRFCEMEEESREWEEELQANS